ncbi:MAG: glycosyltransferase family 4 protein [Candidatus Eisenbacteria bacterium]|nr:glycosyltransferase family 4 protein [Candidatus Eisenbacteria bacterium]
MHVAILIGHFPPGSFGGAEIQAEGWAKRLSDRHRVTVITRRDPPGQSEREERDGFTVVRLPVSKLPLWRTFSDIAAIGRAVGALNPRPDVLLCFQTFVSGLAGVRAGKRLGIPAIVWIRGEAEYRLGDSRVNALVSPRVWCGARGVLVQSEQNRVDLLHELERHAPARVVAVRERLGVIGNGLDLPAGTLPPGTRVLSVGRLIADKGMDVVIDAARAAALPLVIAGDGPERAALEARAAGADCRFEGFASRDRLDTLYREASVAVLAARRGEGLPNVLLEAMAYARPVVATPCAGTRDLLVDGVNGLVIPPDDPAALTAALRRLGGDATFAAALGAEARRTAERFAWSAVRPQLEAALARWSAR